MCEDRRTTGIVISGVLLRELLPIGDRSTSGSGQWRGQRPRLLRQLADERTSSTFAWCWDWSTSKPRSSARDPWGRASLGGAAVPSAAACDPQPSESSSPERPASRRARHPLLCCCLADFFKADTPKGRGLGGSHCSLFKVALKAGNSFQLQFFSTKSSEKFCRHVYYCFRNS